MTICGQSFYLNETAILNTENYKDSIIINEVTKSRDAYLRLDKLKPLIKLNQDSIEDEITIKTQDKRLKIYEKAFRTDSLKNAFNFKINYLEKKIKHNMQIGDYILQIVLFSIGGYLLMWSGWMWYFKIQIYQDRIIVYQTESAKKEAQIKTTTNSRRHIEPQLYSRNRNKS